MAMPRDHIAHFTMANIEGAVLNDETGNFDGTIIGSPNQIDGLFSRALSFSGGADFVNNFGLSGGFGAASIWVYLDNPVTAANASNNIGTIGSHHGFLSFGSTSGSMTNETLSLGLYINYPSVARYRYIQDNIAAGWNHIVINWNPSTLLYDIYLNGEKKTAYTYTAGSYPAQMHQFGYESIGARDQIGSYFTGGVEQARFYNRTLTSEEIVDLFNEFITEPPSDYIALYTMENITGTVINDEAGSFDISLSGIPVLEPTLLENGLRFAATGSYGSTNNTIPQMPNFTISLWVTLKALTGTHQHLLIDTDQNTFAFKLWPSGRIYFYDGATPYFSTSDSSGPQLTIDEETHLVLKCFDTTMELWINGSLYGEITKTYTFTASQVAIGRALSGVGSSEQSNLILDQMYIYDRAVSEKESDALYAEGAIHKGLVAHYSMDNISGIDLFDETGNHDATLIGAQQVDGYLGKGLSIPTQNGYADTQWTNYAPSAGMAISYWVFWNSISRDWNSVARATISSRSIGSNDGVFIQTAGQAYSSTGHTSLRPHLNTAAGLKYFDSDATIEEGKWFHLTHTYNPATGEWALYVNGKKDPNSVTGSPAAMVASANSIWLGECRYNAIDHTDGIDGILDQVRFYDWPLNDTIISALYYEQVLLKLIEGTITESLGVTNWHVRCYRLDNGILTGQVDTTNGTFSVNVGIANNTPHIVSVIPEQGVMWARSATKAINDLAYPLDPTITPYYYKATTAGATGTDEPVWPTSPGQTVVDNEVTWECVERMVQPQTHGPLMPH